MKFGSEFVVPAPPDKVFALFFDPDTMRICLPGCEEFRQVDETTYQGRLVNEVAHVKFRAGFSAEIQSTTEPSASSPGVVKAVLKGEDRRLGSTIKIDATMTVAPQGEDSLVSYELEMAMWGKLGRLGESVIRRRSSEVEKQFAAALTAVCAGKPVPQPEGKPRRSVKAAPPPAGDAVAPAAVAGATTTEAVATTFPRRDPRDVQTAVAMTVAAFACGMLVGARQGNRR